MMKLKFPRYCESFSRYKSGLRLSLKLFSSSIQDSLRKSHLEQHHELMDNADYARYAKEAAATEYAHRKYKDFVEALAEAGSQFNHDGDARVAACLNREDSDPREGVFLDKSEKAHLHKKL